MKEVKLFHASCVFPALSNRNNLKPPAVAAGAANYLGRSSKAKATNPKPLFLMQHFNTLHMPLSKIIILTLEQWLS
jgi:hypothetical protein